MPTYRVTWEIDIERNTLLEAALEARAIMLDPESTATVFTVTDACGHTTIVDLADPPRPTPSAPPATRLPRR